MEEEIKKLKKERDEYLDGWRRAKADFLNYKKEEEGRMRLMAEFARAELLLKVLPVLDNIERALKEVEKPAQEDNLYRGFLQIAAQWREFLKSEGVEEIEALGKPFDPAVHEAVGEAEGEQSGVVAEVVEKGYVTHHGKLLRPAKVKVTK